MLDVADTGGRVDKETYKARRPELCARLVEAQFGLKGAKVPVLIQIGGADRIGCEAVIDLLNEWLDARYGTTSAVSTSCPRRHGRTDSQPSWSSRAGTVPAKAAPSGVWSAA
jgi:hypothetical protein